MKKIASIFFLLTLIIGQMSAQIMDKLQFKGGLMYEFVTFEQSIDSSYSNFYTPATVPYVNFLLDAYYAIAHKNDIVSVGVDAGFQGGLYIRQQGIAYQIQVPAYIMGRLGAGSTTYNQQKFGLGLGVGVQNTFLKDIFNVGTSYQVVKTVLVIPSALAEVTFGGNQRLTGRLHVPLLPMKKQLKDVNNGYFRMSNFGLGLIYAF